MLLALLLGACGGADEEPGNGNEPARPAAEGDASAPSDPCALITEAEVGSETGLDVTRARAGSPEGGVTVDVGGEHKPAEPTQCTWSLDGPDPDVPSSVIVTIYARGGRAIYEASKDSGYAGGGSDAVEGVGDGAYVQEIAGSSVLIFLSGETAVTVQYVPGSNDPNEGRMSDVVTELARMVAERL